MARLDELAALVVVAAERWMDEKGDRPILDLEEWDLYMAVKKYRAEQREHSEEIRGRI